MAENNVRGSPPEGLRVPLLNLPNMVDSSRFLSIKKEHATAVQDTP